MAKGFDPSELMNQARRMKEQMAKKQQELEERVVEASSAGGMVTAFVNGNQRLVGVKIKPEAVTPDDVGMLEDLVMVAVNNGLQKAGEMAQAEMNRITGGLGGMF